MCLNGTPLGSVKMQPVQLPQVTEFKYLGSIGSTLSHKNTYNYGLNKIKLGGDTIIGSSTITTEPARGIAFLVHNYNRQSQHAELFTSSIITSDRAGTRSCLPRPQLQQSEPARGIVYLVHNYNRQSRHAELFTSSMVTTDRASTWHCLPGQNYNRQCRYVALFTSSIVTTDRSSTWHCLLRPLLQQSRYMSLFTSTITTDRADTWHYLPRPQLQHTDRAGTWNCLPRTQLQQSQHIALFT